MELDRSDHEARLANMLADVSEFKRWLDVTRGLTTDPAGRTVILGLDAAETEEMVHLRAVDGRGARYRALAEKHATARCADALQKLTQTLDELFAEKKRARPPRQSRIRRALRAKPGSHGPSSGQSTAMTRPPTRAALYNSQIMKSTAAVKIMDSPPSE